MKKIRKKKLKRDKKDLIDRPKTTQDVIRLLFKNCYFDTNIIEIKDNVYSICVEYSDIAFSKAQQEIQEQIFLKFVIFLNSFSSNTHIQIINSSQPIKSDLYKSDFLFPEKNKHTKYNKIAKELNHEIEAIIGSDEYTLATKRYVVISQKCRDYLEAKDLFIDIELKLESKFKELKSRIKRVSNEERLKFVYQFFNNDDKFDGQEDVYNALAPKEILFKHRDYVITSNKYIRILYLEKLPNSISPVFYNKLTTLNMNLITTNNITPTETSKVINKINKTISAMKTERVDKVKKANRNNTEYEYVRDEKLDEKIENIRQLRKDITKNKQKIFYSNLLICLTASSLEELDKNTERIISLGGEELISIKPLMYQQLEGIINTLPLGHNTLQFQRSLTSEATAINVPFSSKDLMHKKSLFFGMNLISKNAIFIDRKKLLNGNGCVLATSGAGKSFNVKLMIEQILVRYPQDEIIIIDPQDEYQKIITDLKGQRIDISTSSSTFINPFDLDINYDEKNPVKAKTEYLIALVESFLDGTKLTGEDKSIIDRCVKEVFKDYVASEFKDLTKLPTLPKFYEMLYQQPEKQAHDLALIIERFVKGSLDIFSKETNIDIHNKLVCFCINNLPRSLQTTGYLVVLDHIMNRMAVNKSRNKYTWIIIDEFHILLKNNFSAEYCEKIYKICRKFNGLPTVISQNISDILSNKFGRNILSLSEFALILNQKPLDIPDISNIFNISEDEMEYLKSDVSGQGILVYGNDRVIFRNKIPENSYIYKLNETSGIFQR